MKHVNGFGLSKRALRRTYIKMKDVGVVPAIFEELHWLKQMTALQSNNCNIK